VEEETQMRKMKTASWTGTKMQECRDTLDTMFREQLGYGNGKRMDPKGVKWITDNRVDIAETIVNLMQNEIDSIDPLPLLVEQTTGDIRNNYIWQELTGTVRVVDRAYGTKPLSQRLYFREHSIKTSMKETAVEFALEEVFAGRMTPSLAASEMAIARIRYRTSMVLDAIDAGVPNVADRTGQAGYTLRYTVATALSAAVLDKAIDGLQDEGSNATVFGRHLALHPAIRGFSGWSDSVNDELQRRGQIGVYHGANIVTLRDPLGRRAEEHLIPYNKVWVASGAPGAVYMDKPVTFLNWAEVSARDAVFGTGIRFEDGVKVWDPYQYRIITIT
jgi:hypothetical protein